MSKNSKETTKKEEDKFLISSLGKASWNLFKVYYPVFISAVVFAGLNEEDMVTKSEMQQYIDNYLNHPVPN